MSEKRGNTGKLIYDFNVADNLEVQIGDMWCRVTARDFRSFNGVRRINDVPYEGPIYLSNTNLIAENPTKHGLVFLNDVDPNSLYNKRAGEIFINKNMKTKLLILFSVLTLVVKAQFCSTAGLSNQGNITPTSTSVNLTVPAGFKYYWTFTATAGCTYTFSSCSSVNTNDTYLRLYSGTTPATALLVTSNDDNGPICLSTKASIVWTCATTGAYSILLTNYVCANISSSTILTHRGVCPAPLLNDACSNAIAITVPYSSGVASNVGSTDDVPTSTSGCGTQGSNVWYKVVGNNTNYTATTCNASSNFDTEIRVYTGVCGSMTEVICNDDDAACAPSGLRSTVTWCSILGTTYYISVGYFASGVGTGNYVLGVTSAGTCLVLPIELVYFTAKRVENKVQIDWLTATELDNDFFVIDKSIDGVTWEELIKLEGQGTVNTPTTYQEYDYHPSPGYNYYRLKQIDYYENESYLSIVSVFIGDKTKQHAKYVDVLGREIVDLEKYSGMYMDVFDDGTVEKRIKN